MPIFIVIVFLVIINMDENEKHTISYIQNYLYNKYDLNFDYVKRLETNKTKKSAYIFSTTDERRLCFKVEYWKGAMITPWGKQPLIQTRHVVDEFPKAIRKYVVSQSPYSKYDITEVPIDEVAKNIVSVVADTDKILNEYGASWESPNVDIIIVYKGKEYQITFGNQNESSIRDKIVNTLFDGNTTTSKIN